jgi:hypothetical protein
MFLFGSNPLFLANRGEDSTCHVEKGKIMREERKVAILALLTVMTVMVNI